MLTCQIRLANNPWTRSMVHGLVRFLNFKQSSPTSSKFHQLFNAVICLDVGKFMKLLPRVALKNHGWLETQDKRQGSK